MQNKTTHSSKTGSEKGFSRNVSRSICVLQYYWYTKTHTDRQLIRSYNHENL